MWNTKSKLPLDKMDRFHWNTATRFKYLNVCIDSRNGDFLLKDRHNEIVQIEEVLRALENLQ